MSTDEMKIAAAESIGWIPHSTRSAKGSWFTPQTKKHRLFEQSVSIPKYDTDLNAVAALASTLSDAEILGSDGQYQSEHGKFNDELERIVERDLAGTKQEKFYFDIINATAIQRLEAYLITKGLWIVKE